MTVLSDDRQDVLFYIADTQTWETITLPFLPNYYLFYIIYILLYNYNYNFIYIYTYIQFFFNKNALPSYLCFWIISTETVG